MPQHTLSERRKKKSKKRAFGGATLAQLRNFAGGGLRTSRASVIRKGPTQSKAKTKGPVRQVPPTRRRFPQALGAVDQLRRFALGRR